MRNSDLGARLNITVEDPLFFLASSGGSGGANTLSRADVGEGPLYTRDRGGTIWLSPEIGVMDVLMVAAAAGSVMRREDVTRRFLVEVDINENNVARAVLSV